MPAAIPLVAVVASGVVSPVSSSASTKPAPSVPITAHERGYTRPSHWLIVVLPLVPVMAMTDMRSLGC